MATSVSFKIHLTRFIKVFRFGILKCSKKSVKSKSLQLPLINLCLFNIFKVFFYSKEISVIAVISLIVWFTEKLDLFYRKIRIRAKKIHLIAFV